MRSIIFLLLATIFFSGKEALHQGNEIVLQTNENYISGIHHNKTFGSDIELFSLVFQNLADEVTVYPSENYYYWEFFDNGIHYKGNIGLFASLRSEGKVNFGYYEEVFNPEETDPLASGRDITSEDGLELVEIDYYTYDLTFKNKTVRFHLNPSKSNNNNTLLAPGEKFVGTTTDESGMQFNLIFDSLHQHLFWLLHPQGNIVEQYEQKDNGLKVGRRTGFAFYHDSLYHRNVLCGVYATNIQKNTWYDGPFDQLPDNQVYAGKLDLRKYIVSSYPSLKGEITKFLHFKDDPEARVALANYMSYDELDELGAAVAFCKSSANSHSEFLYFLTQDRRPGELFE